MKKKILVSILILALSATLFSCQKKEEGPDPQDVSDSIVAACDEISLEVGPAVTDAMTEYITDKEKKAEKKRKKEQKAKEKAEREAAEAEDPANADGTIETGQNATAEEMIKRYVGKWVLQGIIQSDGNLDTSSGAKCTYVINSDKTYTAKGKDVNGKKIDEKGKWKLNENKQLVCGKSTLGIDDSGYLLKDTGERDGKGRKIKYAFSKA